MLSVLVVDDDDVALVYLRRLLREYFRVITAESATAALGALGREPVDVLLTDLELGVTNGVALLAESRLRFPGTRRMLMSGCAWEQRSVREDRGLFERFFPKPLQVLDLIAAVCESGAPAESRATSTLMHSRSLPA
jgi:DNA-binding NtrC family response regulator